MNAVCPTVSHMHLVEDMDHNEFKLMEDLIEPFKKFLKQLTDLGVLVKHFPTQAPVEDEEDSSSAN